MRRELRFTNEAAARLRAQESDPSKKGVYPQALKTLGLLEIEPQHPGLNTHEYSSLRGAEGERVWEACAQNPTPGAYRIFIHDGPDEGTTRKRIPILTIVTITPHP